MSWIDEVRILDDLSIGLEDLRIFHGIAIKFFGDLRKRIPRLHRVVLDLFLDWRRKIGIIDGLYTLDISGQ